MDERGKSGTVAIIGLGNMGSALAEVLLKHGLGVTVWNRTPAKGERLKKLGATVAGSVAEAASAADIMIVCVSDHAATRSVVMTGEVARALAGKTLVQVSSITPAESMELSRWADDSKIDYLDGAIQGIPHRVLEGSVTTIYSGSRRAFEAHRGVLEALGRSAHQIGERPGMAPALEIAMFSAVYSHWLGFFHGAAICHAAGLPTTLFLETFLNQYPTRVPTIRRHGERIAARDYENPGATLAVHAAAFRHVVDLSKHLRIDSTLPEFLHAYYERGLAAGHGAKEQSALFELMIRPR